jgi:hypothetical protein
MASYQERIFSGYWRPVIFTLLLNLVAMILYDILEILAPEHMHIFLKKAVYYALVNALWVYFLMRALWYAWERRQRKAVSEISSPSDSEQPGITNEEIRERIRSFKGGKADFASRFQD